MADIFISYAREDATAARRLAAELEKRGWSVFWDRRVPAGRHFAEFISEKLAAARCVITLWSRAANASDWVQEEAEEAKKRNILVPALIEQVDPPWGFRRIQAADLLNWQGEGVHEGFQQLLKDIEQYAPSHAAVAQPEGFVGRGKETEQSWPAQPESVDVPSKTLDRSSEKPDAERQALEAGIAASLRAENARQEREQWDTGAKSDADRLTRQDPEQERREPEAERRAADRAGKEHPE
ncbi:MAG: toll/interleukin-1 receptor domain-containing protein, partial [Acidobacteriia bacterium]|nr:toll/interleukin-1 receptor domain-containing protein [Terriglobia bacterium]